jgi:hypothetical protein
MADRQSFLFKGASGGTYRYWLYPRKTTFEAEIPGNYIHVLVQPDGTAKPIYVGETGDLNKRLRNHEKQECVDANGANGLCVHKGSEDVEVRRAEEKDIMEHYLPACNKQVSSLSERLIDEMVKNRSFHQRPPNDPYRALL